jgi:hypothetical protein
MVEKLVQLLNELETKFLQLDAENKSVSKASVAWHIAHILLTNSQIILALKRSNPRLFKPTFSFMKWLIFTTKKIPRGKVKSSKNVTQENHITLEYVQKNLHRTNSLLQEVNSLDKHAFFEHPFLKKLDVKSTIKFLEIHTQHHLSIINDIISPKK